MARGDVRDIVSLFKKYYTSVNKISDLQLKITDKQELAIVSFCDKIRAITNSPLQEDYMQQYFEFQFNRHYKKRGVRGGKGEGSGIKLNWIISNSSLKEWTSIESKWKSTYKVRKNLKTDIDIKSKFKKENWDSIFLKLNDSEEKQKEKFLNSEKGFLFCTEFTLMYNHKSDNCLHCKFVDKCKARLLLVYPKIYKKRGYE